MNEREITLLGVAVTMAQFIVSCFIGKYMMVQVSNSWLGFNGPAIGILLVGELIWWSVRKCLVYSTEGRA